MTVKEIHRFLAERPDIESGIKKVMINTISEKRSALPKADFAALIANGTIAEYLEEIPVDRIRLNYNLVLVNEVLLRHAVETLGRDLPNDILGALKFVNDFCELIRMPTIRTFWYEHLEGGFEGYILIYLNQIHGVDVTGFLQRVTKEDRDNEVVLRAYELNYEEAFPYLTDDIKKTYETIEFFYATPNLSYAAVQCLTRIGIKNPDKALELYEFAKENNAERHDRFLPSLLIELYPTDAQRFFDEAVELHGKDAVEGLIAIAFFKYQNMVDIDKALGFVTANKREDVAYKRMLVDFYCRVIENPAASSDIISNCFTALKELFKTEDEPLKLWLMRRVSMISGHDVQKFTFLSDFLAFHPQATLNNFFDHFNSPELLFGFVRDAYLHHGLRVNLDLLKHAISMQFHQHHDACEQELLGMLRHDLAIIRHAGTQVLTSNAGRVYSIDFLKLDEEGQKRVIETILLQPIGIEEILPLILRLRNSPFPPVVQLLVTELTKLIWAYDQDLIELVKPILDQAIPNDKELFNTLEKAYDEYSQEKQLRNSIKEFDPRLNESESFQLYFRLENEKNAEMVERASTNSFFTQMSKTVSVIRGNAFKSENNPTITRLQTISTSRLVDQRYYVDPEYYEWTFQLNVYGKNYGGTE